MKKDFKKLKKKKSSLVSSKLVNLLKLLGYMESGRTYTVKELSEKLQVTKKTIYRYFSTLEEAHIPVYKDPVSFRYSCYLHNKPNRFESITNEDDLQTIVDSAHDAIIVMNNDGNISYWNKGAERIYGYTKEEVIGKNLYKTCMPARLVNERMKILKKFRKTGDSPVIGGTQELINIRKDGTEFPMELSGSALKINGKWNAIGIGRDITEKKISQKSIYADKQNIKTIVDSVRDGVMVIDFSSSILYWNSACKKAFGYTKREVIGTEVCSLLIPERFEDEYREKFHTVLRKIKKDKSIQENVNLVFERKDSIEFSALVSYSVLSQKWKGKSLILARLPIPVFVS